MGEVADSLINGEMCSYCGVFLEPNETVYVLPDNIESTMPYDGSAYGIPVICSDCHED